MRRRAERGAVDGIAVRAGGALNNEDTFFGYYPIRPNKVVAQGETIEIYDLVGKDTVLFHHSINDGEPSGGAQQVQQARMGFDSVWETIGRDFDLDAR
ncbi:hypothetical protein [Streptomyces sp. SJL17-1]|uniref:hypothetical protein n=1 Tax=Streptomyces sp. SJL17-1 TaxID=2967223 RepID=UPI002965E27B|nr:hypothetical protein [Streptomyces sp. SJL17-1]